MRPGLIRPERGEHEVVCGIRRSSRLNVEGGLGLHQKEILADDGGVSLAAYREWQAARGRVIEHGSRPEHKVFIATQALDAPPDPIAVQFAAIAKPGRRAAGRRFGTLVHNVMRDVPLDADRGGVEQLVDWNMRLLGSPVEEREAAIAAVESALASPLLGRGRAASRCHREYPLVLNLEDGRVLEGFIDLAFVEDGQWVIVDFKTDADTSTERRAQYERQIQWYGFALKQITNMPARAWLLEI